MYSEDEEAHMYLSTIHRTSSFNFAACMACKYCQENGLSIHQTTQFLKRYFSAPEHADHYSVNLAT